MLLGVVAEASAQFSNSETVYCYKYDYTNNDGIKSKNNSSATYYFVNFQNNMMGYITASDIKYIRQKMLESPSYYEDTARNNLASRYSRWKSSPSFYGSMIAPPAIIFRYYDGYSSSSKYTYREFRKSVASNIMAQTAWWSDPSWGTSCYSFSTDKSEMIVWSTSDSENRDYYKRINMSDLKPNTDFLY